MSVLYFLVLIVSAAITEILGIHALFGAFMAGVVMPSNFGFRKVMMEKVEDIALVFFYRYFLLFTGLRTQIGLINTPELWCVCLLLITVAVVGKFGGCAVASRLVGESWKDSFTIGTFDEYPWIDGIGGIEYRLAHYTTGTDFCESY